MKINEIIRTFADAGSKEAKCEAYLTIEHLFSVSPSSILADKDREYDDGPVLAVVEKRKKRIPLQHIFGKWSFMGKSFLVSDKCLIPRQDTEIVVEKAINVVKKQGRVADLCTGSGCIGISLLLYRPDITELTLVDISEDALNMARKNAHLHHISEKCSFMEADATCDILVGEYDAILANPPYILTRDMDTLSDEVKMEPYIALDGGEDGLDIIRPIIYNSYSHLKTGGCLIIEFGFDQGESMRALLNFVVENKMYSGYEILYDYGGNVRACLINK
ncbi:MAG: peptide chain release factor N(5)-glutamine methyltransferase [Clostridia bacterium]|nr:peptide chain release factor N(5)-glutamine methyltransferase [Clostridia bacterium]